MPHHIRGQWSDVIVDSDGGAYVVPDTHLDAKCEGVNLEDPWAEHKCELKYGSWTYDGNHIDLQAHKDKMDLADYEDFNQVQVLPNGLTKTATYSAIFSTD